MSPLLSYNSTLGTTTHAVAVCKAVFAGEPDLTAEALTAFAVLMWTSFACQFEPIQAGNDKQIATAKVKHDKKVQMTDKDKV